MLFLSAAGIKRRGERERRAKSSGPYLALPMLVYHFDRKLKRGLRLAVRHRRRLALPRAPEMDSLKPPRLHAGDQLFCQSVGKQQSHRLRRPG